MKRFKPLIFSSLIIFLSIKASLALPLIDTIKSTKNLDILSIFQVKCNQRKEAIKNRAGNFDEKKDRHMEIFNKFEDRLELKISYWEEMGYDVDELKKDLEKLDELVDEFSNLYSEYIATLRASESIVCGDAIEFGEKVDIAREQLELVRKKAVEIKNHYYNTVRVHILELKQQTPAVEED